MNIAVENRAGAVAVRTGWEDLMSKVVYPDYISTTSESLLTTPLQAGSRLDLRS